MLSDFRKAPTKPNKNKKLESLVADIELDIQSVNFAAQEMLSSANQISENSTKAANMTSQTLKQSEETEIIVNNLNSSSEQIGEILGVVSNITNQVNLLALNAAIEAARAGDAGRGFAVVASEIKELANQTKNATKDIEKNIKNIQKEVEKVLESIVVTTQSVRSTDIVSRNIAVSIAEQNVFNEEIIKSLTNAKANISNLLQELSY